MLWVVQSLVWCYKEDMWRLNDCNGVWAFNCHVWMAAIGRYSGPSQHNARGEIRWLVCVCKSVCVSQQSANNRFHRIWEAKNIWSFFTSCRISPFHLTRVQHTAWRRPHAYEHNTQIPGCTNPFDRLSLPRTMQSWGWTRIVSAGCSFYIIKWETGLCSLTEPQIFNKVSRTRQCQVFHSRYGCFFIVVLITGK